ncbi:hypothetical protein ES703_112826 [subsurface metagenome]
MTGGGSPHVNAVTEVTSYHILLDGIGGTLYVYAILITTGDGITGYGNGVGMLVSLNTITGGTGDCVAGDADRGNLIIVTIITVSI